ncbi:MAG: hypothetical protein MUD01_06135, partial [Chloroflexaceae bacterium]|nr:hypothetical protein [Chloroflexaceae bacterium]
MKRLSLSSQPARMVLYVALGFAFGVLPRLLPLQGAIPWYSPLLALLPFVIWGLPALFVGMYEYTRSRHFFATYLSIMCFWLPALAAFYITDLVWYQIVQPVWMNVPWPSYVAQAVDQFLEWAIIAVIMGACLAGAISLVGSLQRGRSSAVVQALEA